MSGFVADFAGAEVRVSPNFGPRLDVVRPDLIILHYTGMATGEAAEAWLCNPESQVSSHYLVHEDGRVIQMVREADRAWHAGRSSWHGATDINSRSIGIEIVNEGPLADFPPFHKAQIAAVAALCRDISSRLGILPRDVLAHSDVAPGRKVDPGPRFPWADLSACGVGHMPGEVVVTPRDPIGFGDVGARVESVQSMLQLYGYGIEITGEFDPATRTTVEAFQLHFRPARVDGVVDAETHALLVALVSSLPRVPLG